MKLKELLDEVFKNGPVEQEPFKLTDYTLYGKKYLESLKDEILKCEEFSECEELTILDTPTYQLDGQAYSVKTYKVVEGQKFGGKGFLLSMAFTPQMYNPDTIHKPVKDGACITPTIYNPNTFEPLKKIVLEFSPERVQDGISNHDELIRQELHELLDKVMDSPNDYMVKGERYILVRGVFELNEINKSVEPPVRLSTVHTEPDYFMVFYFEPTTTKNQVNMNLSKKFIPNSLKDKFYEQFKEKITGLKLTGEEIEQFLNENKI